MIYYFKNNKKNIISLKEFFVTSKIKFFSFSKRKNVKLIIFFNRIFIFVEKKILIYRIKNNRINIINKTYSSFDKNRQTRNRDLRELCNEFVYNALNKTN